MTHFESILEEAKDTASEVEVEKLIVNSNIVGSRTEMRTLDTVPKLQY